MEYEIVLDEATSAIAAYGTYTSPSTIAYHTARTLGISFTLSESQVTEVTDGNYHNNFNDVIKLGPLETWYKSSSEYLYTNK